MLAHFIFTWLGSKMILLLDNNTDNAIVILLSIMTIENSITKDKYPNTTHFRTSPWFPEPNSGPFLYSSMGNVGFLSIFKPILSIEVIENKVLL